MKVVARLGREALVSIYGFAVQLADRILIAALLLRLWGVDDFAAWSLVMAAGGMISFFDFGVNLYFANRVLFLVQQGRRRAARTLLYAGNLLMIAASAVGVAAVAIGFGFIDPAESGVSMTPDLWLAACLIALSNFFRAAASIQMSVYRAHERYARQSLLGNTYDLLRIIATLSVVLAGGSILAAAAVACILSFVAHAAIVFVDSRRQFPDYPFKVGPMPRRERWRAAELSLGFWIYTAPTNALTYLPIFLLTGAGSAALLVQFVLMRTIANFVRTALQPFAVVFGQESARRVALDDIWGLASTYRESTFFLAALGAVQAGLLIALGADLFTIWTGQPDLFSQTMLLLAIGPPLLLPSLTLAQNFMAASNDPWPIAYGRIVQLVALVAGYLWLPIDHAGLRMMAALALAEPIGLGMLLSVRIARTVPGTGVGFHLQMVTRMSAVLLGTLAAASTAGSLFTNIWLHVIAGLVAGVVTGLVLTYMFGMEQPRRLSVERFVRSKLGVAT